MSSRGGISIFGKVPPHGLYLPGHLFVCGAGLSSLGNSQKETLVFSVSHSGPYRIFGERRAIVEVAQPSFRSQTVGKFGRLIVCGTFGKIMILIGIYLRV